MKLTLTLALFCLTQVVLGQNYQPINSNSLQVFYQDEQFNWASWAGTAGNMWGTRIDSFAVSPNGDTTFYNYRIYRDTTAQGVWSQDCIWWNAPNWNGRRTRSSISGHSWFYNEIGDSITIFHSAQTGTEWLAYTYPNGDSLIGFVSGVEWSDDGWTADSVKTINFILSINGDTSWTELEIELYKESGIRQTLDFMAFPFESTPIHRIDLNFINQYSPGYNTPSGVRPFPSVGDGAFRVYHCEYFGDYSNGWLANTCSGPQSQSEYIMNVSIGNGQGELAVTQIRNTSGFPTQSVTETVIYFPLPDSLFTLIRDMENKNLMPREEGAAYVYRLVQLASGGNVCHIPAVSIYEEGFYYDSGSSADTCIRYGGAECTGSEKTYAPYIGLIDEASSLDNGYCTGGIYYDNYYRYLKHGNRVCGEPIMVGIEEASKPTFSIYPNPTNGPFQIQMAGENGMQTLSAVVTDMFGQTVDRLQLRPTTVIDASQWASGVYSVSLVDENGARHTERLVVQH